jgi:hypothetical protein
MQMAETLRFALTGRCRSCAAKEGVAMRVVDLRHYVGPCVYVGRPMGGTRARDGSPLANPFTPRLHGADCLRFYREWLEARVADGWPPVHRALAAISRVSPCSAAGAWTSPTTTRSSPGWCVTRR